MQSMRISKLKLRMIAGTLLLIPCMLVGCSELPNTISGQVTLDGQPLTLEDDAHGTVVFQPANRQGPTLNGVISRNGEYQLTAGSMRSIDPGLYLATVSVVKIVPANSAASMPIGQRIIPERYSKSDQSGLRVIVGEGANRIELKLESEEPELESLAEEQGAVGTATSDQESSRPESDSESEPPIVTEEVAE